MRRIVPRLRLAGLALPLLTAGCASGIVPNADAADPSCMLLCALTREITGEPVPQPAAVSLAAPAKAAAKHALVPPHVAVPKPAPPLVAKAHPRIRRPAPIAQVSVVPQAPSRLPTASAMMVPAAPAPIAVVAAPAPAEPAQSLTQAIPGSAGIVAPIWQAH